jgi:hypothetical protein
MFSQRRCPICRVHDAQRRFEECIQLASARMIDCRKIEERITDAIRLQILQWRAKAEELRTIADGMKDEGTRRLLRNAAANYIRLADEAEEP